MSNGADADFCLERCIICMVFQSNYYYWSHDTFNQDNMLMDLKTMLMNKRPAYK